LVLGAWCLVHVSTATAQDAPSFTVGAVSVGLSTRVQVDWQDDALDLRRARVGVQGKVHERVKYELEHDLTEKSDPWQDAYVNVAVFDALELRAGRFKMPFSLSRLASAAELDFIHRPLAATWLAPGRDSGVMAHGSVGRGVKYQAGVFAGGGDRVRDSERRDPARTPTAAARITVRPMRRLTVGASSTLGTVPEGRNSLAGRDFSDATLFPRLYVNGRRMRVGAEAQWDHGPVDVNAEFIRASDERRGQAIDESDLPDVVAGGWHVSGTWRFIGKKDTGALEMAGRVEQFRIDSHANGERPSTSERAAAIIPHANRAWTLGINWYVHRWVKLQAHAIREQRRVGGETDSGSMARWTPAVRLQLAF
jgi:phosphate-selective porin OprO/OprP